MAIKTARELVLLPYTQRTVTERPGGRGGGRDRGERTLGDSMAAEARRGPAPTAASTGSCGVGVASADDATDIDVAEALAIVDEAVADAEAGAVVEVVVEPEDGWCGRMKVLLRDDIAGVGRRGDIVKVAGGFARNFLLPEGRAIVATDGVEGQAAADAAGSRPAGGQGPGRRPRPRPRCWPVR